jgi:uncharacterized membrane protein
MESKAKLLGHPVHTMLIVLVTGWLGGELVNRLSVGVDDGVHENAPSSLSSRRFGS